jgi:hypothetical protein
MKPEQDDRLEPRGFLSQPTQRYLEGLQPPKIVGQVENPALETARRFWWRGFDRVCLRSYGCRSTTDSTDQNRRH